MSTDLIQFGEQISSPALRRAIQKAVVATAIQAEANAKRNLTTTLHARTGRLRNSIRSLIRAKDGATELVLQAGGDASGADTLKYAATHEYGAIIRPKRRKYLAIPLQPAKTAAGVSRYQTPRDAPGLHFVRSKRGNLLLVAADGEPWFVLKTQVKIPKRPYLKPALAAASRDLVAGLERVLSRQLALEAGA